MIVSVGFCFVNFISMIDRQYLEIQNSKLGFFFLIKITLKTTTTKIKINIFLLFLLLF